MNINRESADANDHNLQLFKQWGELSLQDKLRLTAALRAAPRFEMVEIEEEEGEELNRPEWAPAERMVLAALKRSPTHSVSQTNFRRLDNES